MYSLVKLCRFSILYPSGRQGIRSNNDLYLSFVNFSFWGEEGDVLGNLQ